MQRLLIVEDDDDFREFLTNLLVEEEYECESTDNPITAIEMMATSRYDLLISDLWLPDMNGIRLVQSAKNIQPNIKTIILTAEPNDETEFQSISSKIDLYIVKNKSIDVLKEYVRMILEQNVSYENAEKLYSKKNNIVLNITTHIVTKDDEEIELTMKEFELLKVLLSNMNRALSRDDIMDMLWDVPKEEIEPRVIDVHIRNLRTKLKVFSIMTIRGYGYKWNE